MADPIPFKLNSNNETYMNSKPNIRTLVVSACVVLFAFALPVFGQLPSPSVSPSATMQVQDMNRMPSTMSDSMTKMSEMCMTMMQQEKAAMPYMHRCRQAARSFAHDLARAAYRTRNPMDQILEQDFATEWRCLQIPVICEFEHFPKPGD